jgi:hypothetical protein
MHEVDWVICLSLRRPHFSNMNADTRITGCKKILPTCNSSGQVKQQVHQHCGGQQAQYP